MGGIHTSLVLARGKVPSGPADTRRTSSIRLLRVGDIVAVNSCTTLEWGKISDRRGSSALGEQARSSRMQSLSASDAFGGKSSCSQFIRPCFGLFLSVLSVKM